MVETTILNPQYVYVQATTPSDLTQGKLWYNTTAKALYSSDGSSYSTMTTDLTPLEAVDLILQKQNLEQGINILINSVASTSTLNDWEDMFVDNFTDADGTSDTIDTGNTTAIFSSDKYTNQEAFSQNSSGEVTTTQTEFELVKTINISAPYPIISAISNQLKTSAAGVRTYCKMTLTYSDDTTEDTNIRNVLGSGYLERSYTNPNLTKAVKKVEVYLYTTVSKTGYEKLTSLAGTITQNRIVQTNAITCVTGATHHQVYCKNTTAGTGTATYNISFDNGSTWDTTQAFNTLNNAGSTTGTQMILKLNLIGSLTPDTAEANNYGIMLFY